MLVYTRATGNTQEHSTGGSALLLTGHITDHACPSVTVPTS